MSGQLVFSVRFSPDDSYLGIDLDDADVSLLGRENKKGGD